MLFASLLRSRNANPTSATARGGRPQRRQGVRFVPSLEGLEDRTVPSTFPVTNVHDHGAGSLRQAVLDANAHAGADTITFANNVSGTIALTTGELDVTGNLTVNGPGACQLAVSGTDHSRVFHIESGATVTLGGLTITNGRAGTSGGGGIKNEAGATLNLNNDVIRNNQAVGVEGLDEFGGGLLNLGTANITGCAFTGNQALGGGAFTAVGGSAGGAIDNFGGASLTAVNTAFTNNSAVSAAGAGYFALGGAIENNAGLDGFDPTLARPSTATLLNCTFQGNLATGGAAVIANGGAIVSEGLGSTLTLTGCVVSHNRSVGGDSGDSGTLSEALGGGVMNISATMTITGCVISNNQAVAGNSVTILAGDQDVGAAGGGGLENNGGTMNVLNSVISLNVAQGSASASSAGGNAVGGGISNDVSSTLIVTNCVISNNLALGGQGGAGPTGLAQGFGFGGGVETSINSAATISGSILTGNIARGGAGNTGSRGGDGLGGAIAVGFRAVQGSPDSSQLTLLNCIVAGNEAIGGAGGHGADGGDGLGGGLFLFSRPAAPPDASATVTDCLIVGNDAVGGHKGSGGTSDGDGIGGGVYNDLGTFTDDLLTVIALNFASTSHNNIYP